MAIRTEVGSEFTESLLQTEKNTFGVILPHQLNLLSGRTALSIILDDILKKDTNMKAYVPTYCCDSMLEPFIRNGFSLEFYSVEVNEQGFTINYDFDHGCDVALVLHYFGYYQKDVWNILEKEKKAILIQDITHSVFTENGISSHADYWFCSLRKWTWIPSIGVAWKKESWCQTPVFIKDEHEAIIYRKAAQKLKQKYLESGVVETFDGNDYRTLFQIAEGSFDAIYENYPADTESVEIMNFLNIDLMKKKRKANAEYIHSRLVGESNRLFKFLFAFDSIRDTPLFVPIVLPDEVRAKVLRALIGERVYTPQHWPVPSYVPANLQENGLYTKEVSLICDQRYSVREMERQCDILLASLRE